MKRALTSALLLIVTPGVSVCSSSSPAVPPDLVSLYRLPLSEQKAGFVTLDPQTQLKIAYCLHGIGTHGRPAETVVVAMMLSFVGRELMQRSVRAAVLLLGVTMVLACDPRTTVRTVVHAPERRLVSEQCIAASLDKTGDWYLGAGSDGGLVVFSRRSKGRSFNLSLSSEKQKSIIVIEAAMITGRPDEQRALKDLESAERSVAAAIVGECAEGGVISCWDHKKKVEVPQCFP